LAVSSIEIAFGILTISVQRHHRKAMGPAFHYDAVKGFIPVFVQKTKELFEIWSKIDDKPIYAQPTWMPKYTLDVLSKY